MKAALALVAALVAGASSQETTDSAHLSMLELLARVTSGTSRDHPLPPTHTPPSPPPTA